MMAINLKAARDYVYEHGRLWEQALFAHLFQGGSEAWLEQCLLCYKNPDGGFGHGLEPDISCPDSHPAALEFLLATMVTFGIGMKWTRLLDGTVEWVAANQNPDGSLKNPASLRDYPAAPWWNEWGGQTAPDSIVGNLARWNFDINSLKPATMAWVENNLTEQQIQGTEWLFMAYHAYDYYMGMSESLHPAYKLRSALTKQTISHLIETTKPEQYGDVFRFIPDSAWNSSIRISDARWHHILDTLENAQQPDGSWHDQHELSQWYSYSTIRILYGLKSHGHDIGTL
ncbi:MAG: hypothetical protein U0670_20975 [Anaerolineae bacterium]